MSEAQFGWVRVKDNDTGHELSVSEREAESGGNYTILKGKDAVDAGGTPLAPVHNPDVGKKTAAKSDKANG